MTETLTADQDAFLRLPENSLVCDEEVRKRKVHRREESQPQPRPTARALAPRLQRKRSKRLTSRIQSREPLRSVSLRLRTSVAEALRRASVERSLDYVEPFSQQSIVETALRNWLCCEGYLSDDDR